MLREAVLRGADVYDAALGFDADERAKYLNASEAMSCIRKEWYRKFQPEASEGEHWGYARRGRHAEEYVVERLRLANVAVLFAGEDQTSIYDDDLQISATPDGLVWDPDKEHWVAVEIKSFDPRTNRGNLPRMDHVTQVQIAAAFFQKYADDFPELGGYPVGAAKIVYINASDFDDILEFPVPLANRILERLSSRARRLLKSKSAVRLPREGKEQGGYECKTKCSFNGVCGVDGASTSTGQGHKGAGDLSAPVGQYLMAAEQEKAAKEAKDAAAELIKANLKKREVSRDEVDGHTVELTAVKGRETFDKKAAEAAGLDLSPFTKIGKPSERLTVK